MAYRETRNITASIIDSLTTNFTADWSDVNVERTFSRVYEISLPVICVRLGPVAHTKVEIGSNATSRQPQLLLDVFATSEGQREDLTDYLVEKIKHGFIYYEYVIVSGVVDTKTEVGRINVKSIDVTQINFEDDKNELDIHDRNRALITCEINTGKYES